MNKFYFTVRPMIRSNWVTTTLKLSNTYLAVRSYAYSHDFENPPFIVVPWQLPPVYSDMFYVMCKEPVKALLYLKHDNNELRAIAKKIVKCKEPVEVKDYE